MLSNHRVGQAVCDRVEPRHQRILPDYVWGDGDPAGVQERATDEMIATVRAAQKLGVGVVSGFLRLLALARRHGLSREPVPTKFKTACTTSPSAGSRSWTSAQKPASASP